MDLVEIKSDVLYLGAMRDGLLSMQLQPGSVFLAPEFQLLETQPFLLLSGLLCGASFLHVTLSELEAGIRKLKTEPAQVFGVSRKIRERLLESPQDLSGICVSWFRNPAGSIEFDRWQNFSRNLNLVEAYSFNMRWDAASGGCSLISAGKKGISHPAVMPPPGSVWMIDDMDLRDDPTFHAGLLSISLPGSPPDEQYNTGSHVNRHGEEWIYTRDEGMTRFGTAYPYDEILEFLNQRYQKAKLYFGIATIPRNDLRGGRKIDVIVFAGLREITQFARIEQDVRSQIEKAFGADLLPDSVAVFPRYPRFMDDHQVDLHWCRDQYLTGWLRRRSHGEVFRGITQLRSHFL